ncbi:unnamed protein product [Schistosoma margrebowiei]|uniref:Uncharacterized protein n=1 Tax=Schistosoma margrebowiei TaxID=48269 RepID=A0A3P8F2N3_9TREM|nr:unnamed protein product [Schistosoma margrebowiei]
MYRSNPHIYRQNPVLHIKNKIIRTFTNKNISQSATT